MERQLAEIEKRQAGVETTEKASLDEDDVPIASTIARRSNPTTQKEDKNLEAVGQKVAKDFGEQGVFFGSIISVEYDSDDEAKEKPFYVVQYTDGDKEDLNEEEYGYAHELCFQMELDAADEVDVDSATDEEESYRQSSKVE
jgi:hypothetical protein